MTISRWSFTQAVAETKCPRCDAGPGDYCHTPTGRKAWPPHGERQRAYYTAVGPQEFARRHSIPVLTMIQVMDRMKGE